MITKKLGQIGEGALSKVFEGEFDGPYYKGVVALKQFSYGAEYRCKTSIETYEKIRYSGIPVLKIFEHCKFDGEDILVLEHINVQADYVYVSYNTMVNGKSSVAEQKRAALPLKDISDFTAFLQKAKTEIGQYTMQDICLYFDCYFFGSALTEISDLTYKVVDLDNIEFFDYTHKDKLQLNLDNFKDAITGFITHFVEDGQEKQELLKQVNYIMS